MRYVRKTARPSETPQGGECRLCGARYGLTQGETQCPAATCLFCETTQCLVNGLGHGNCGVCHIGLLPGWSGSQAGQTCSYAGCQAVAVAFGYRGKRLTCQYHSMKQRPGMLARALEDRENAWREVDDRERVRIRLGV